MRDFVGAAAQSPVLERTKQSYPQSNPVTLRTRCENGCFDFKETRNGGLEDIHQRIETNTARLLRLLMLEEILGLPILKEQSSNVLDSRV